jgi:SAM-dependent methyltransferase
MSYKLRECPLCGTTEYAPLFRARDYIYGNSGEYEMVQCTNCTLGFLDPMFTEAELSNFYPKDYYAFSDRFGQPEGLAAFKANLWKLVGLRQGHPTKDPKFERPGRLLDIGCGSGWFLFKMRDRGWEVQGVEPNVAAAEFGAKEKGLCIFPGSLLDARLPAQSFDYIRLNHSFEHMEHPNQILGEIYRLLADGGKVMIGVPNREGLNARMFGPYWYHLALPLHPFSYSTKTLSRMLTKHNFTVQNVIFNTDYMGVLGSIQILLNRKKDPPSSVGRFVRSRLARLLCCWTAHLQNALHVADVIEITATKQTT